MQKGESGLKWWTSLAIKNPRGALLASCGIIIVVLAISVRTLYKDRNATYQEMLEARDLCSEQKLSIIYGAIKKQEEMNVRYTEKVEQLYDQLNEINKTLRRR